jgi:hypothetical protein
MQADGQRYLPVVIGSRLMSFTRGAAGNLALC